MVTTLDCCTKINLKEVLERRKSGTGVFERKVLRSGDFLAVSTRSCERKNMRRMRADVSVKTSADSMPA